ncbi:beta strand repeat-containing protein [Adhaeribacter soli]|uniref:T9SS type A sorting domain-containing protein n=1 Tax=Adhaeribacter soli TaxID=2607655 RepID=A0A5N1J322_9BACT|nr:T9SS type A sorting domain-containing protein [Adhaeribacter soli]KAA9340916.1 T9SS type A sorting domain-containing protein [Adhaeribacter soli]
MQKQLPQKFRARSSKMARLLKRFGKVSAVAGGLLLGTTLNPTNLIAQSIQNNYDFSASSGTFTPLGASATQMPLVKADGYLSPATPIGFTFNFDGVDYSNFRVSSDGYISFGTSSTNTATNDLAATTAARRPLLAPLWDDLDGKATGGSNAAYEVTGTAGSRVFTYEWLNWEFNWSSNAPVISFQVKLYEGSNKIEFIYRPESGSVNSGGASVGIAGVGTGLGNFISLNNLSTNPSASYTTETTNISSKPAAGQTYTFTRVVPSAIDIATTGLVAPSATPSGCFGPNQTVQVSIKNNGTAPLNFATTPVTVNASGTVGTATTTFPPVTVNSGTLAPGASQTVTVSTTYNMSTAGTYTFNAAATVAGDGRASNDAMVPATVTLDSRQVPSLLTLPQVVQFDGFTGSNLATVYPGWTEASGTTPSGTTSNWTSDDFGNVTGGLHGIAARINLDAASDNVWIISPKFTPTATTALRFDLALTNWNGTSAATMGSDDELRIMVSTDCGATYSAIRTFNASTPISNTGQSELISLASYAGQDILVAFYATEGTVNDPEDNDLFIDNIILGTPATNDLGVTALVNPVSTGCYGNAENVTVTIRNNGSSPINFATNNATVRVNTSGATAAALTATVNTGTLAAGATQNVSVGTINMLATGTYNLKAFTSINGDTDNYNDTITIARSVAPRVTLPQVVWFDGFTGSNLATVYPGWTEASGTTPSGTTSNWTSDDFGNVTGGLHGIAARINLDAASDNVWIISPKFTPTATTALRFDLALTNWNGTSAATMGSDDELRIMVSTDCGATYSAIRTFNASTPISNTGQSELISLASYAGQDILVAFYATEGTVNDPEDNDLFIDNIILGTPATNDLGVTALVNPVSTGCYGNAENVTVTIRNNGSSPINFATNNATVRVNTSGATAAALTATVNTGTLAAGATQNVSVGTINMLATGTYSFKAFTSINGDTDTYNDTLQQVTRTVAPTLALPQKVDFNSFTGANLASTAAGWYEASGASPSGTTSSWTSSATAQTTALGSVTAKINFPTSTATTRTEWIISPKVPVTTASQLQLKAAVTGSGTATAGTMNPSDTLFIMYSTNCGVSFSKVGTITSADNLNGTLQTFNFSLASLAGQDVIFGLYAKNGTPRPAAAYDLHIDDVIIRNQFANDLSPIIVKTSKSACGLTSSEQVCIVVRNEGTAVQSNIPVSYRINNGVAVNEILAGPIQPGDTLRHCFTANANFAAGGTYNLKLYTGLSSELYTSNDTITYSLTSYNPVFTASNVNTCGSGPVTLTATASNNTTINWYTSSTGGTPVSTGLTYSPTVTANTTYYVEAIASGTEYTGRTSTIGGDGSFAGSGGIKFNANSAFTLQSVVVYPNSAAGGTLVINLKDAANAVIATTSYTVPGSTSLKPVTVPLNFSVPAGTGYTLEQTAAVELIRDFAPASGSYYPITSANGAVTLTDGTIAGYYYYFFNWAISNTCASNLVPVTVTVNAAPAIPTVTAGGATTFCAGGSVALTAASTTAGATYEWFLNGTVIPNANSATYNANASGSYTVVALTNGCPSAASTATVVTVNAAPATPTVTQNGNVLTSSATTGNQWFLNGTAIPGATSATYTATANGSYTVVVTTNGCDSAPSAAVVVGISGIADALAGMSVDVYPNPATGSFNVKLKGYQKDATVVLYNLAGQQIAAEKVTAEGNAKNISLKGLAAGTYLLKVTSEKGVQVTRLIVQ